MEIQTNAVKSIKYFSGLNTTEIEMVKGYLYGRSAVRDEMLLTEGEWSDYLYFLVSGMVKVFKSSPNGRDQILHIALPGDPLNYVSIFDNRPTEANILTMTPVDLYTINKNDLYQVINKIPTVGLNIIKYLANRVHRDSEMVKTLSTSQTLPRLAKLFTGKYAGIDTAIGLLLNQQDMAGIIGTTREVINRSLKKMEQKGAIKNGPHGVVIINEKILLELANDISDSLPLYRRSDTDL